jgi:diguanylate cyclase
VETEAQLEALRSLGCDDAQGYLFAPPAPVADMDAWLASR